MAKRKSGHSIPLLRDPQRHSEQPLYMRLYHRIREGVLRGAIPPGTRLPSSRTLAGEEEISRNTVEAAFRQLRAEGFVVRRVGAGSWINEDLPSRLLRPRKASDTTGRSSSSVAGSASPERWSSTLSTRGRRLYDSGGPIATPRGLTFAPCVPGMDAVPRKGWDRVMARHTPRTSESLLGSPPAGLAALREAVATYLHLERGVRCTPERVVILNSTQQAIDLVARLLLDPDDSVWLEDPGYVAARRALSAAGARLAPVPVDDEGVDVEHGASVAPEARLAYVTPSHQYPLGVTLSLARRLALLEWAEQTEAWILEDDYDSELRYAGRPLASIQGIDDSERVLYAGTFNKILFPGVRLAYLVLPSELVEPIIRAKEITDGFTPPLLQAVLAEFIDEGFFSSHLRRVRKLYRDRRDRFISVAGEHLPDHVRVGPAEAGMHVALHLPDDVEDDEVSAEARRQGLAVPALSNHAIEWEGRGLLVHYGNAPLPEIERGTRRLGALLASPG